MLEKLLNVLRLIIPRSLFRLFQPTYHYLLALLAAIVYRFPSRSLKVIAVTGTKGKSTTVELTAALLAAAGHKVASVSTVRFRLGEEVTPNLYKMTTPGRFFLQRFLRRAVKAGCNYMVIEISSEAAKLYRHKFIALDALIFTNLSPEHIESHGTYERYVAAKLKIAEGLSRSTKADRVLVVNADDVEAESFLKFEVPRKIKYQLSDAQPISESPNGTTISVEGVAIETHLHGTFNVYNMLGAIALAKSQGVSTEEIKLALERFPGVPGRVEYVYARGERSANQTFDVIVDYAHTADSLTKIYEAFKDRRKICVLGGTGGGRDRAKRTIMGEIANTHCVKIFLTNEDPYDEDPAQIIDDVAKGITQTPFEIIMDRRAAIAAAIKAAEANDVILITGKGTDPYIMGPRGEKLPWSDARIAQEELTKII
jgi:UDP-N-acetylmuramoyl-L-alanyl-D-glutamate--2,6-diaminopimelate ligase